MADKKILTLNDIKKETKKFTWIDMLCVFMGIIFLPMGIVLLRAGILELNLIGIGLGAFFLAGAGFSLFDTFLWIKCRMALPKDDNWDIQIEIRRVLGKFKILMPDPDGDYYDEYIIIEPGSICPDPEYKAETKEFKSAYTNDKAYIIKAEGRILHFFSRKVELGDDLQKYVIPSAPISKEDENSILKRATASYQYSLERKSVVKKCLNCGRQMNYNKYQNCCKFCKKPMGYSDDVVMDMIQRGVAD